MIKRFIKKILNRYFFIYNKDLYNLHKIFFSQEGEDVILKSYLTDKECGFYVDVGAYHPKKYSNTFLFYNEGWRGINIDASFGSMTLFNEVRKRDVNLEMVVSNITKEVFYYKTTVPEMNTINKELVEERERLGYLKVLEKIPMKTVTLKTILDQYLPQNQVIDFLSIDCEGEDINVLKSNDWVMYRPEFIVIENSEVTVDDVLKGEIHSFLNSQEYNLVSKLRNSSIYRNKAKLK